MDDSPDAEGADGPEEGNFGDLDGSNELEGLGGPDDLSGEDAFDSDGSIEGGGDSGTASDELRNQVDELEDEIAGVSSTVSTVRSENEAIGETVEEIEENVRKLLGVYEMITQGVNPLVDEYDGEIDVGFDSDGGPNTGRDSVEEADTAVANADASEAVDGDFAESPDDEALAGKVDTNREATARIPAEGKNGEGDRGMSFAELKEKYENGDADRSDEYPDGVEAVQGDGSGKEPTKAVQGDGSGKGLTGAGREDDPDEKTIEGIRANGSDDEAANGPAFDGESNETVTPDRPEGADEAADVGEVSVSAAGAVSEDAVSESESADDPTEAVGSPGADETASSSNGGASAVPASAAAASTKPYLIALPGGYVNDFLLMEWLEYLVTSSDLSDAAKAIDYYERIDWISGDVADELYAYLTGFGDSEDPTLDGDPPSGLTVQHHMGSLWYVSRLAMAHTDVAAFERLHER